MGGKGSSSDGPNKLFFLFQDDNTLPPGQTAMAKKQCSHEGCTDNSRNGGVFRRHGSIERVSACLTHGAKVKRSGYEGCTKLEVREGVYKARREGEAMKTRGVHQKNLQGRNSSVSSSCRVSHHLPGRSGTPPPNPPRDATTRTLAPAPEGSGGPERVICKQSSRVPLLMYHHPFLRLPRRQTVLMMMKSAPGFGGQLEWAKLIC